MEVFRLFAEGKARVPVIDNSTSKRYSPLPSGVCRNLSAGSSAGASALGSGPRGRWFESTLPDIDNSSQ